MKRDNLNRSSPGRVGPPADPSGSKSSVNPNAHKGYYKSRRIPHYDNANLYQFITYRLADSLPRNVIQKIQQKELSNKIELAESDKRIALHTALDRGNGSCILRWEKAARCVMDTWMKFHNERYECIAWVVMPNHVHIMIRQFEGHPLSKIVHSWKSFTSSRMKTIFRECAIGRPGGRPSQGILSKGVALWQKGYWDRYIRDEEHYWKAIEYIHSNPVKAELSDSPQDWPYSSISISFPGRVGPPADQGAM